jgi:hypothetical protein
MFQDLLLYNPHVSVTVIKTQFCTTQLMLYLLERIYSIETIRLIRFSRSQIFENICV